MRESASASEGEDFAPAVAVMVSLPAVTTPQDMRRVLVVDDRPSNPPPGPRPARGTRVGDGGPLGPVAQRAVAVRRRRAVWAGGPQVGLPPGRPWMPASPMRMPLRACSTAQPRARRRVAASGAGW